MKNLWSMITPAEAEMLKVKARCTKVYKIEKNLAVGPV